MDTVLVEASRWSVAVFQLGASTEWVPLRKTSLAGIQPQFGSQEPAVEVNWPSVPLSKPSVSSAEPVQGVGVLVGEGVGGVPVAVGLGVNVKHGSCVKTS